jgi:hypothetical protein
MHALDALLTTPVKWALGLVGFVLFYIGVVTTARDSEEKSNTWLGKSSKRVEALGQGALRMQSDFLRETCENYASLVR